MARFASHDIEKLNEHSSGNENIFVFVLQPLGGVEGLGMVSIIRAKKRDQTTRIRNDNALFIRLHIHNRRFARTDQPALSP